jgi:Tol biopolymer transport system component
MWNKQNSSALRWVIVGVLGILLPAGCWHHQEGSTQKSGLKHTKIAFVSYRDGNGEIYVMNPDGSGQENLTNNPADDTDPSWSPDGRRIVFASDRDGNAETYIMNADGANQQVEACLNRPTEIYIMNADGTNQRRLTSNSAASREPCWSPDGQKIAFCSVRRGPGIAGIYTINTDGSGLERINDDSRTGEYPSWSPDGKKIAFLRPQDGAHNYDIYVADVGGSRQRNLTNRWPEFLMHPSWSPDGERIAFDSSLGLDPNDTWWGIYVINADGTGVERLTNTHGYDGKPSWSPDGKKIVFESVREDIADESSRAGNPSPDAYQSDIYIINADGTSRKRLTDHPEMDGSPAWSPFLPAE